MNKIYTGLFLENGTEIYFDFTESMRLLLFDIEKLYNKLSDFDGTRNYRDNMIRTVLSDIDIESMFESSVIDSIAAICCGKIKTKNQKTALNMLKILESGLLDKSNVLSHEYLFEIWSVLTHQNNNYIKMGVGYRKSAVNVYKVGRYIFNSKIIHKAPSYNKVPALMTSLFSFLNNNTLLDNSFMNAIVKGILFNGYFVYVHPFLDGNGRTSRLLLNKYFVDSGLSKFRYISLTYVLKRRKTAYSSHLVDIETKNTGDFSDYILFMLSIIRELFDNLLSPNRKHVDVSSLSERQKIMLKVIMGSSQGISEKTYKYLWNKIASENKYAKINIEEASKDIIYLFDMGLLTVDERYIHYPGFKYYNK